MPIIAYDPGNHDTDGIPGVERATWPERIEEADFIVFTCSLNAHNRHMLDAEVLARAKPGVLVVNVARGPLIDETALISALHAGRVSARSEEHTSELQSLMRISYAVFCLKKKKHYKITRTTTY